MGLLIPNDQRRQHQVLPLKKMLIWSENKKREYVMCTYIHVCKISVLQTNYLVKRETDRSPIRDDMSLEPTGG